MHSPQRSPLKCDVGNVAICFVPMPSIGHDSRARRRSLAIIRGYQRGGFQGFGARLNFLVPPTQTSGLTPPR